METILLGSLATAILAGGWAYMAFFSRRARLRRAPRVPIAEAEDGRAVKVSGRLRLVDAPLTAPLTGRSCAYFRAIVKHHRGSGYTKIIDESDSCARLIIEDDTGSALVDLVDPVVVLHMDTHLASGILDDATPALEAFLARHGESSTGWVFNKSMRYEEGVLEEGEAIAVYGLCRLEPDPEPRESFGYRDLPLRPRIVPPKVGPMLISDKPDTL